MRTLLLAMAAFLVSTVAPPAAAQTIAQWVLNGTISSSNPLAVTTTAANVSGSPLMRSAALTTNSFFANAFVADDWPAGAVDLTKYFEFSVKANTGFAIDYQTVRFSLYNNFNGISAWEIRSSADGYLAILDSGVATGLAPSGQLINANVANLGSRAGRVTFRVYTSQNSGSTNPLQRGFRGSAGGGSDLTVLGTVSSAVVTIDAATAYVEDFESGPGAWGAVTVNGSSWEHGVPAGATITSADSGSSAMMVDLDGQYSNSTFSSIQATFDFTALTTDPLFKMALWYDSEISWDGVNVEVDTGGGFLVLGSFGDPFSWFNDTDVDGLGNGVDGWNGDSLGWVTVAHSLDGVAGSFATIRINFGSDPDVVDGDGAAVDTIRIVTPQLNLPPGGAYLEDFEGGTGGWQVSGTGATWEHGAPTASTINAAYSGAEVFATDLNGNYLNSTRTSLERTFDLTSIGADPTLVFRLWTNSESSWDGANVEMDVGAGFDIVGAVGEPAGWYDDPGVDGLGDPATDGWSGNSGRWFRAAHALSGAAGNLITLRINFGSDEFVVSGNGAAVDDIEILAPTPRFAGTDEDLVTSYSIDSGPTSTVTDSVLDAVDADPGDLIAVGHDSPIGTLYGRGEFVVLGSLGPFDTPPITVLPGIHLGSSAVFLVTPQPAPGLGPLRLVPGGYHYGFIHPGGAASGLSVFFQAIVIDGLTANMIYASTHTLEVLLN